MQSLVTTAFENPGGWVSLDVTGDVKASQTATVYALGRLVADVNVRQGVLYVRFHGGEK